MDAHHARVAVGDSLAIRVFREKFVYFKYGKIGESYSLVVATTSHVTPFFSAVFG